MNARKKSASGSAGSPDLKPKWEKVYHLYRVSQDFTGFHRISQGLTGFDRIWQDLAGFGRIWQDFQDLTGFGRI